jgi:carbamoyl-phosphate synthase large subunit
MITSVGSLVGHNLLEALEHPPCVRRERVFVIGTNSVADSPNNFRCERSYHLPETSSPHFVARMVEVLQAGRPDLILCGRDQDTEAMARLLEDRPELPGRLPYGSAASLGLGSDKWETWRFAQRHDLPFAATFCPGPSGGTAALRAFADSHGYPLVAKPRRGFASRGVAFARHWGDVEVLATRHDYVFQEYLGDPGALRPYFDSLGGPPPLFTQAPDLHPHTCQTLIHASGAASAPFVSRNLHEGGVTVAFERIESPDLARLALDFARALHREGGRGPLGVQFRRDRAGRWKAQEINLRTNGNTFARLLMGEDELASIVDEHCPEFRFPAYRPGAEAGRCTIRKLVTAHRVPLDGVQELLERGVWSRAEPERAG